jgi:hypothetical protein
MALESATYINQLVVSNPGATDTVAQADDHLRLIKTVLKNTFPNITGPVTSNQDSLNQAVPTGLIAMWAGVSVPSGWFLCDGDNGTPDLRDRFIVGANTNKPLGTSGGTTATSSAGLHSHSMTGAGVHNHTGLTGSTVLTTDQIPAHTHTWSGLYTSEDNNFTAGTRYLKEGSTVQSGSFTETTSSVGGDQGHTHTIGQDGEHAHALVEAGTHTHTLTPPYYALAFIMKA